MRCPGCNAQLGHITAAGEPMIRNRGLVLKAEGIVAVCPRCKGDVPFTADLAKALQSRIVLFFSPPGRPPKAAA